MTTKHQIDQAAETIRRADRGCTTLPESVLTHLGHAPAQASWDFLQSCVSHPLEPKEIQDYATQVLASLSISCSDTPQA